MCLIFITKLLLHIIDASAQHHHTLLQFRLLLSQLSQLLLQETHFCVIDPRCFLEILLQLAYFQQLLLQHLVAKFLVFVLHLVTVRA